MRVSWSVLEASWNRLGGALDASWVRLGGPGACLWGFLGHRRALWRYEWRQNKRFHLACHLLIDFERNLFPKVIEKSVDFMAKVLGIKVF